MSLGSHKSDSVICQGAKANQKDEKVVENRQKETERACSAR
jgi:hypothetical protein